MIFLAYEIVQKDSNSGMKFYAQADEWARMNGYELERESEIIRENCDLIFGGEHIVIRHWEGDGPKPAKTVKSRRESQEQLKTAMRDILHGADTKTKRWLQA